MANLAIDVSEKLNLAKEHLDVVQRLLKVRKEWVAAQRNPTPKATYQGKARNER